MILDIRQFEYFPAETVLTGETGCLTVDFDEINELKKVRVELKIQQSGEEYFCQGDVKAVLNIECSRCLEGFDLNCEYPVDFIACAEKPVIEDKDILDAEDYALFSDGDLQADISDILRQALILSLPLKPLCSEECKGLCAQCGTNLNEQTCSCKTEYIDPRWEALQKLTQQTKENKEHS